MEELLNTLSLLFGDEIESLYIGNTYNKERLSKMRDILFFIQYNEYMNLNPEEYLKLVKRLDYEY